MDLNSPPMAPGAEPLSPSQIAERCRVRAQSVYYWQDRGLLTPDGDRLRLPFSRTGTRRYTSSRDLTAFLKRCQW